MYLFLLQISETRFHASFFFLGVVLFPHESLILFAQLITLGHGGTLQTLGRLAVLNGRLTIGLEILDLLFGIAKRQILSFFGNYEKDNT